MFENTLTTAEPQIQSFAAPAAQTEQEHLARAGRLLLVLYRQAIDGLHEAARAADEGRIADRLEATVRCSEAICELHLGLDFERGGQIAASLDQLYRFIQAQVPQVNLRNDAALARRLAGLLEPLIASWTEVVSDTAAAAKAVDGDAPTRTEPTAPISPRVAAL